MTRAAVGLAALALLAACGGEERPATPIHGPNEPTLVRPDTPGNTLMFHFDAGDVVETYGSPGNRFLIHYTRAGRNAVPLTDADASGVPDFVEQLGGVYDEVLAKYQTDLGFRAPVSDSGIADNGGDGRFDAYLVDFMHQGDGNFQVDACDPQKTAICAGYMIEENDFVGYGYPSTLVANRILASHEFFHAVQAAYDSKQGPVFAEGSAVWATETFDPTLNDFEDFLPGYFDNPDRPLDLPFPGAADPFSYGAAIFFEFLDEHYGQETIRELWERVEDGSHGVADPYWLTALDPLLKQKGASFPDAMVDFASWNLATGDAADPVHAYANGASYPDVLIGGVTLPHQETALRVFYASTQYFGADPAGRASVTAALIPPSDAPEEVDGLRLLVATRASGPYTITEITDLGAGTQTVSTTGASEVVAFVVNTRTEDPSRKPSFCFGTKDEVKSCRASLPVGGSGGGGAGGGAVGAGGGGTGGGESGGGCGCQVVGEDGPWTGSLAVALFALAARTTRRRRRRAT